MKNLDRFAHHNKSKNIGAKKQEPIPRQELEQLLLTVRVQRDEWKQKAKENEEAATQIVHVKQQIETIQCEVQKWQECANQSQQLYDDEQNKYQQTFNLYNEEKARATEFLAKYEEANFQREQYANLYIKAQTELKYERRSKAGIKGWENRRKRENERLKQEIGEMTLLLRDSLERKDEAVNNLYILAERMDRIQQLVDTVEEEPTSTPIALLQKLKRIWFAVREILAE